MKRNLFNILIIGCLVAMTACGKIDEVSQKMIDDIDSLSNVTIDDEAKVQKLFDIYNTLTDKQKEQVTNYTILLEAKDTIDELISIKEA